MTGEPYESGMIVPEDIDDGTYGGHYVPGHWNYRRRCADVELALVATRERVAEWDRSKDPHGWWHDRPVLIAIHNEIVRLRHQAQLLPLRQLRQRWEDDYTPGRSVEAQAVNDTMRRCAEQLDEALEALETTRRE